MPFLRRACRALHKLFGNSSAIMLCILASRRRTRSAFFLRAIRDEEKGAAVFQTRIAKAPLGWTGMYVAFPHAGEYTLHATYQNGDEDVTEASFPLSVEAAANMWNPLAMSAILMMGSMIAGGLLAIVGKKAMRR